MHSTKVLLGLALLGVCALSGANASADPKRDGKLLNIFQVVRFPNEACNTTANDQGVCYTEAECKARDGTNAGSCASGFGVCCSFSVKCGATTNQNNTYFTSTDTDTSPCTVKVCKRDDNICSIRLDFKKFEIAGPNDRTQCMGANFIASSEGNRVNVICGKNTGQHMLLEASDTCNDLTFSWTTASPRSWEINIVQYSCDDPYKPPNGCTQYYTAESGTVSSYNFDGGIHLANQNQLVCIRSGHNMCSIEWTQGKAFSLSISSGIANANIRRFVMDTCNTDYVTIPEGFSGEPVIAGSDLLTSDRYCGDKFLRPGTTDANNNYNIPNVGAVISKTLPFELVFSSDATDDAATVVALASRTADQSKGGFQLKYAQKKCA